MPSTAKPVFRWTTYRFDQLAELVNDRVDDPSQAGVDRYVGLEHLDAGSLRISRWGEPSDVTATKLRFRPGDTIFGRRRVYQRKVAVADFEGICSAHAMVLRARPDAVLPEFLPYFMQTDHFMERALEISVGSLSPTINWKALAKEEFALPPVEEQDRLVQGLHAAARARDAIEEAVLRLEDLRAALGQCETLRHRDVAQEVKLEEVAQVRYGLTVNQLRRSVASQGPYLRVANVQRGSLDLSVLKKVGVLPGDSEYELQRGDVLVVEGHASETEVGRAVVWDRATPGMRHQNHLIRIRACESLAPEYLAMLLNSPHGRRYFLSRAKSSSGLNTINSTVVKQYSFVLPPRAIQDEVVSRLYLLDGARDNMARRIRSVRAVGTRLLSSFSSEHDEL